MAKDAHADELYKGLKKCFEENTYFDVIAESNWKEFKAHKLILGMHSDFMDAKFKRWDTASEDKETSKLDLSDEDPAIVEAMLCYMYSADYSAISSTPDDMLSPMMFNVRVYALATKCIIEGLQELAAKKFDEIATKCWETDDFTQAINEIYSTTPASEQGLRKTVVRIVCEHISALLKRESFVTAMESNGELGVAVLRTAGAALKLNMKSDKKSSKYFCTDCLTTFKIEPAPKPGVAGWCMYCGAYRSDWKPVVKSSNGAIRSANIPRAEAFVS